MPASGGTSPGETSPPPGKAVLKIPLPQAQTELQERIAAGRQLAQTTVTSLDPPVPPAPGFGSRPSPAGPALPDLNAFRHYLSHWRKTNRAWLSTNLGGEAVQEYEEAARGYKEAARGYESVLQFGNMTDDLNQLMRLRRDMALEITTLESIRSRLPLWNTAANDGSRTTQPAPATPEANLPAWLDLLAHEPHDERGKLRRLPPSLDAPPADTTKPVTSHAANRKAVMLIYGHDQEANNALFDWLRATGLQPREWTQLIHDTATATPYTGQILDHAFAQAQAVIALFTPDEYVTPRTPDPSHPGARRLQSRPNVLIETGMALATHPNRTILAVLGNLQLPSDLAGLHHIRLNHTDPAPLIDLANRLRAAGCDTDTTGTHWLNPARFPDRTITTSPPT